MNDDYMDDLVFDAVLPWVDDAPALTLVHALSDHTLEVAP